MWEEGSSDKQNLAPSAVSMVGDRQICRYTCINLESGEQEMRRRHHRLAIAPPI